MFQKKPTRVSRQFFFVTLDQEAERVHISALDAQRYCLVGFYFHRAG
jgi:hypothetical protein